MITDEIIKVEHEIDKCASVIQPDDADSNNVYSPNMSSTTNPGNEAIQNCEGKKVHYEEKYISVGNEAYEHDKVMADKMIGKINTDVNSKRTRRSNRLSVNDKKENLKTTISGKILKQKKTMRKSNKIAQTTIPNEILTMLYKKFESQKYENSMLPPFRYIVPNNTNNALQYIPYGIVKQEGSHYNLNNNRNMLQYLDYNNMRSENLKQPILMNSNPWSNVSKSGYNFINNINTQNQVEQSGFINDKQYHNSYTTADYNLKQSENPYFQSSIKSTDPHKLLSMENKVFHCSCNACTSNMWNNMHTCGEVFPKVNSAFQQIVNNNALSYTPLAATSDTWNTTVGSFNYFPNYQPLQADYNFKRLFYSGFNTINNATNNGYNVARRNIMSPLNNWNTHINHLTIPCNNNTNIALDASVPSDPLSSSFYTGNTNTQFSNYYNIDLAKANMSVDQYKEKDNLNPSTMSTFENSVSATNMHRLDSESTNTLSQNTSNENDIIYDITNFVSETDTTNTSEESQSYTYIKEMDKNWSSNISNI